MPLEIVFCQEPNVTYVDVSKSLVRFTVGAIYPTKSGQYFIQEPGATHYFDEAEMKEVKARVNDYITLHKITRRLTK